MDQRQFDKSVALQLVADHIYYESGNTLLEFAFRHVALSNLMTAIGCQLGNNRKNAILKKFIKLCDMRIKEFEAEDSSRDEDYGNLITDICSLADVHDGLCLVLSERMTITSPDE